MRHKKFFEVGIDVRTFHSNVRRNGSIVLLTRKIIFLDLILQECFMEIQFECESKFNGFNTHKDTETMATIVRYEPGVFNEYIERPGIMPQMNKGDIIFLVVKATPSGEYRFLSEVINLSHSDFDSIFIYND